MVTLNTVVNFHILSFTEVFHCLYRVVCDSFAHLGPPPRRGIRLTPQSLAPPVGNTGRKTPLSPAQCTVRPPPQTQFENSRGSLPQILGHSPGRHKQHKQHSVSQRSGPWSGNVGGTEPEGLDAIWARILEIPGSQLRARSPVCCVSETPQVP